MELNYVGKIKLMANAAIHLNIGQLSCFAIFPFFSMFCLSSWRSLRDIIFTYKIETLSVFLQTDRNTRGGLEERGNTNGERIFTAFQEQSRVFNSLTELNTDRKFAISFGNHRSEK